MSRRWLPGSPRRWSPISPGTQAGHRPPDSPLRRCGCSDLQDRTVAAAFAAGALVGLLFRDNIYVRLQQLGVGARAVAPVRYDVWNLPVRMRAGMPPAEFH